MEDMKKEQLEVLNEAKGYCANVLHCIDTVVPELKGDKKQILQLQGDGVNSLTVSYLKAPSEEAMEHMHDLLTKSMEEFRVENINIHGKVLTEIPKNKKGVALYSGGKDSGLALSIACESARRGR